jgi:RNA polymerase sigma factor (sigma-70 family)
MSTLEATTQSGAGRVERAVFTSGQDEQELVAAVRRNDDQAFGELYSRYERRIVSYVFGMVGDHGRAEDIAQEVFISALRRMRATERPIAFKPWIYEIAKNACIDEFRRTRRAQEIPLEIDDEGAAPARQPTSRGQSPHTAFERRQQLDDLRGAFRGLSDHHHKVLVLRELEGLSYTEIGRRMGMTRPVVESTLFRARRKLGEEYEEIASGRRCEQVQAVIDTGGARAVRALGIRERRRLSRHVSHCQPCRRYALLAGVDDSVLRPPSLAEKIAALLPIPAFLRFRRGGGDEEATSTPGSHAVASLQSVQTVAQIVDPASPAALLGRAAAAVAAVAIAGGGVATVVSSSGSSKPKHPTAPGAIRSARQSTGLPMRRATSRSASGSRSASASPSALRSTSGAGTGPSPATSQSSTPRAPTVQRATTRAPSSSGNGRLSSPSAGPVTLPTLNSDGTPALPPVPSLPKEQVPNVNVGLPQVNLPQVNLPQQPAQGPLKGVPGVVNPVVGTLGQVNQQLPGH